MEKIIEQGNLFDFYSPLLTEHQRRIFSDYVFENLSLSEIAEEQEISRQGVHDLVKRIDKILNDYEDRLHLEEKFTKVRTMVEQINEISGQLRENGNAAEADEITRISNDIIDTL